MRRLTLTLTLTRCTPTPQRLQLELLVVAILFVCAACIGVLLRRKRRLDSAAEARQRWVDGVMQQVGYQLYSSEDEYREAMDAYMLEHGLSGTEESHYLDFIRYTMSEQESRDPGSPTRAIGKAAKAGFGGMLQMRSPLSPPKSAGYNPLSAAKSLFGSPSKQGYQQLKEGEV